MKCIITSGPMETKIDNVRSIVNSSTGTLGSLFVQTFSEFSDVVYIYTDKAVDVKEKNIKKIKIDTPKELLYHIKKEITDNTVVIHLMAVRDFDFGGSINLNKMLSGIQENNIKDEKQLLNLIRDSVEFNSKLSSKSDQILYMEKDIKVIDEIKKINKNVFLVGFKLLSNVTKDELVCVQKDLLKRSNCDIVVGNIKEDIDKTKHKASILYKNNLIDVLNKKEIVKEVKNIIRRDYEKNDIRNNR